MTKNKSNLHFTTRGESGNSFPETQGRRIKDDKKLGATNKQAINIGFFLIYTGSVNQRGAYLHDVNNYSVYSEIELEERIPPVRVLAPVAR